MVDSQNNTEEDSLEENSDLSNEDGLEGHLIDETALDAKGRRRSAYRDRCFLQREIIAETQRFSHQRNL